MSKSRSVFTACGVSLLLLTVLAVAPQAQRANGAGGIQRGAGTGGGLSADTRAKLMDSLKKGTAYLQTKKRADGRFDDNAGVTAVAVSAIIRQPGVAKAQSVASVGSTLDYLRSLAKPDGGIYIDQIPHYITATSLMALVDAGDPKDRPIIEKGRRYLADHLLDEGEGVAKSDKFYGGLGYGGLSDGGRADIISLEYGLRAMKEAGLPDNDPAWQKAITFLQRTQNNSETNDQKGVKNDGGFIYYPGYSQVDESGGTSYGAATYAGLMSYSWANVKKSDQRVQSVMKWIRDNYTVDESPGTGSKALYYYYMVFAKALQASGENVIVDSKGQRHNWREDLGRKLISLQHPEGFWVNTNTAEMQGNPTLVTALTVQAIEAILQ